MTRDFAPSSFLHEILLTALTLTLTAPPASAGDFAAPFQYQGQLKQLGVPTTELCDMQFTLMRDLGGIVTTAGTVTFDDAPGTEPPVSVENGLFEVSLDYGMDVLTSGDPLFLEVKVRCPSGSPDNYVTLRPWQPIKPAPRATHAAVADELDGMDGHSLDASDGHPTDALIVDTSGRVGVGTANPRSRMTISRPIQEQAYQLELRNEGSIQSPRFDGIRFTQGATGTTTLGALTLHYRNNGNPDMSLDLRSAPNLLFLDATQRIGVGTTSPLARLDTSGTTDPQLYVRTSDQSGDSAGIAIRGARNADTAVDVAYVDFRDFDSDEGPAGTDFLMARIAGGMQNSSGQTGVLRLHTNDGSGLKERIRVASTGDVGIGTTAPQARLHVVGPENDGTNATLRLKSGPDAMLLDGNEIDSVSSDLTLNANSPFDVVLASGGGHVGIGAAPQSLLHMSSAGPSVLTIEADTDDAGESDNARIEFSQDGGTVTGRLGFGAGTDKLELTNDNWDDVLINAGGLDDGLVIHPSGLGTQFGVGGVPDTLFRMKVFGGLLVTGTFRADSLLYTSSLGIEEGGLGIGTDRPSERLHVCGNIKATGTVLGEILGTCPDYVFEDDYDLMPIEELENYVRREHHLPGVPSAAEFEAEGIDYSAMSMTLLEKVEQLTLYMIEQNHRLDEKDRQIRKLQAKINHLTSRMQSLQCQGHP